MAGSTFRFAEATSPGGGVPPQAARPIRLEKPQNGQAVTVQLDGQSKLDFSDVASEKLTFVRVGDKLIVLFDNQSTVTVEPVFDSSGRPLADIAFAMAADRTLSGDQFAELFPITTDQSVLPAAGPGGNGPTAGAHFGEPVVETLSSFAPLDLLGGENPGPTTFGLLNNAVSNPTPIAGVADVADINEDGLAGGNPGGIGDTPGALNVTGSLHVNFGADAIGRSFSFASDQPAFAGLTSDGQAVHLLVTTVGGLPTMIGYVGTDPTIAANQVFTVSLDASTSLEGTYTFTLLRPLDHPIVGTEDTLNLSININATDGSGDTTATVIHVNVNDDMPVIVSANETHSTLADPLSFAVSTQVGSLGISWGADRFNDNVDGGVSASTGHAGDRSVVFADALVLATGHAGDASMAMATLTSRGDVVHYALLANGTVLIAYTGETIPSLPVTGSDSEGSHEVSADIVFIVTLSDASDAGNYVITQYQPLDHASGGQSFDSIDLSFHFTATDSDGDGSSNHFTVTVVDDVPVAGIGTATSIDEGRLPDGNDNCGGDRDRHDGHGLSVTGALNIQWGADHQDGSPADRSVGFTDATTASADIHVSNGTGNVVLRSDGNLVHYAFDHGALVGYTGSSLSHGTRIFEVSLDDDDSGSYTFKLLGNLDHPAGAGENLLRLTFDYTATDSDGDRSDSTFTVAVVDDVPTIGRPEHETVSEANLPTTSYDIGHPDGWNSTVQTGNLDISWGADRHDSGSASNRSVAFTTTSAPSGLTSNGFAISYSLSSDGTLLTATSTDHRTIFTISLNDDGDGSYRFTLYDNIDHAAAGSEDASRTLSFAFRATDSDGDSATDNFSVTIADSGPTAHGGDRGRVDEDDLPNGTSPHASDLTVHGDLNIDWGADDGNATPGGAPGDRSVAFRYGNAASNVHAEDSHGHDLMLKSDGLLIKYAFDDNGALVGYTGADLAGGTRVFEVSLSDRGDGSYTFKLLGNLDHPGGSGENTINLSFSFTATDGDGDGSSNAFTVTVKDDVPTAQDVSGTTSENAAITVDLNGHFSLGADSAGAPAIALGTATLTGVPAGVTLGSPGVALNPDGHSVTVTPGTAFDALAAGQQATLHIPFTVTDADGDAITREIAITITGANDAPVLTVALTTLPTITEDTLDPAGTTVASLLGSHVSDIDAGAVQGIAITGATVLNNHGVWQFSTNGGASWSNFVAYSTSSALLLAASDLVRFVPDGIDRSLNTFSFVAWDQTTGSHGGTADASVRGGSTSFSTTGNTASVIALGINDAPVVHAPATVTTAEDTPFKFIGSAALSVTDVDLGDNPVSVVITTAHGSLHLVDTALGIDTTLPSGSSIPFTARLADLNELLKNAEFTPDSDFNGDAGVTIAVNDLGHTGAGGPRSDTETITVHVTPVNDAPVLANMPVRLPNITEDAVNPAGVTVATLLGSRVTDVDAGALQGMAVTSVTGSHGSWQFSIDGGAHWNSFAAYSTTSALLLGAGDLVRFVPDAIDGAVDTFTFVAWDQTAGSHGDTADTTVRGDSTAFSTATDTTFILVAAVNDAPVVHAPSSVTTAEDTPFKFTGGDALSVNDVDLGTNPISVVITTTHGSLHLVDAALGIDTTLPSGSTVPFMAKLGDLNELLKNAEFTPDPDFNGDAKITIAVNDLGSAGAGGAKSDTETITIHVTPVNDAPVAVDDGATTDEDTPLTANAANGVLHNDTDPDAGDTRTVVAGDFTTAHGGAIHFGADGSFTYTPAGNFNGVDSVDYTVKDAAGASDTGTLTITVNPVNDAPFITVPATDGAVTEDSLPTTAAGVFTVRDVDLDIMSVAAAADGNGYLGTFTTGIVEAVPFGIGQVTWNFSADNATLQSLAGGETRTQNYTITIDDHHGGTATEQVAVNITGVNDIAVISAPPPSAVVWSQSFEGEPAEVWPFLGSGGADTSTATDGHRSLAIVGGDGDDSGPEVSVRDIEQTFHFAPGALGASIGYASSSGSAFGTLLIVAAGTYTISFDWKYSAGDVLDLSAGYNDFAYLGINGSVHVLTDVATVGDYGKSNWANYTITFSTDSALNFVFGAMNTVDEWMDGELWIDNLRLIQSINADTADVTEDGILTGNGRLIVTDADHDQSAAHAVTTPTASDHGYGTYMIAADGSWSYSLDNSNPDVQALHTGQALTDSFTFASLDGSATRGITITIHGTDDVPVITGTDTGTTTEDVKLTATGLLTVTDPDSGQSHVQPVTSPHASIGGYGSYTVTSAGAWTYQLNNGLAAVQTLAQGAHLTDSFTVWSADGSTSKTVTVRIDGTNDAPTVTAASGTAVEDGASIKITLSGDDVDSDDDGASVVYQIVSGPASGSGTASIAGKILTFNPGSDFQGLAQGESAQVVITYQAVDRHGAASAPASVTITVNGQNDAPHISFALGNDRGTTVEDGAGVATGQLTAVDVDHGAALTWSVQNNGAGQYGKLAVDQSGTWSYTLDQAAAQVLDGGVHVTETFTVRVTDEYGASSQQNVIVTIDGTADAPVATGESYRLNVGGALTVSAPGLLANDTDVDSTHLQVQLVNGVAHGSLTLDANGSFLYTPTAGYTGDDAFTYRVSDGSLASNVATVAIHVNDPPRLDLDADNSHAPGTGYVTTYTEGGAGVAIADGDARISDSDDSQIERMTVMLTNGVAGDSLVIKGDLPAGLTASFVSGALVLTGSATIASYESALQHIVFTNSNGNPGLQDRIVTVTVNDGEADSNTATSVIHVAPYDDPPVVTRLLGNGDVIENQGGQVVATFSVSDPDTLNGLTFAVTDNAWPWYQVRATNGTVYGQAGNYEIYVAGHFTFSDENADGDPTVTHHLAVSDGTSTIDVPFTFTVTQMTVPPQPGTDSIVTNAAAGQIIEVPDEVFLRNDTDPDSVLSVTGASFGAVHFGGEVLYTTPASFPASSSIFFYNEFDGAWNRSGPAFVNGVTGHTINGTVNPDILVAATPTDSVGNLATTPYTNPALFGEGHLVNQYVGQTFVAAGGMAQDVRFALDHVSGGDLHFHLLITTLDSAADPDPNAILFTSEALTLKAGSGATPFDVDLHGLHLDAGTSYAFVLEAESPGGTGGVASVVSSTGYAGGVFLSLNPDGGTQAEHFNADWSSDPNWDMAFLVTSTSTNPVGSTLNGGRSDDSLIGAAGNDTLNGNEENDWLYGMAGDDTLNGGSGNDRLVGGPGSDTLTGGNDADTFRINAPTEGLDHILDFNSAEGDVIELLASAFGLSAGANVSSVFGSDATATAQSSGERFHFDTANHTLYYDADGSSGSIAAVALARLENGATLIASDIHLA